MAIGAAPKRGDLLRKAGDIFNRRKKELARIMTREMGKPTFETEGDVQEAIDTAYYAASKLVVCLEIPFQAKWRIR